MSKARAIWNATLKALLAGVEASSWVKVPAAFISELAGLSDEDRKALASSVESEKKFEEMVRQLELSTWNAASAAAGTEQIKVVVSRMAKLTAEQLSALKALTQERYEAGLKELHRIRKDTRRTLKVSQLTYRKLNNFIKRFPSKDSPKIKRAVKTVFLDILKEKNIPERQWPEKLREISMRHEELVHKWQIIQSKDTEVKGLKNKAYDLIELGHYDQADDCLREADDMDQKAIDSQKDALDQRRVSQAQTRAYRGDIARTKTDYQSAIELYEKALETLPQNEERMRAIFSNNLGSLYDVLKNYPEAETHYKQALAIDEAVMGRDDPAVATDLNNLGQLYKATNRVKEAERMMERALRIYETALGKDHLLVAICLNNQATLYNDTGRFTEAEPLLIRAKKIFDQGQGENHLYFAIVLNNLAQLYKAMNRFEEAELLMEQVLYIDRTMPR